MSRTDNKDDHQRGGIWFSKPDTTSTSVPVKRGRLSLKYINSLILPTFCVLAPPTLAGGDYDGLWIGTETATIPGYGTESAFSWTIIYQDEPNSLYLARTDLESFGDITSMLLVKQGSKWVLPAPINETLLGIDVVVDSLSISFSSKTRFTGDYIFEFYYDGTKYEGTVDMSHTKKSCVSLGSSAASVSGISGSMDSVKCYRQELPMCATNFSVSTSGGSGDVDLYVGYGQPDFDFFSSEDDENSEAVYLTAHPGTWYIGLYGFTSYSGVGLQTSFIVPDSDGDGVGNCIDSCPTTPTDESVDASGCAESELDDDTDGVPNGFDNCPAIANTDQLDNDTDGEGDACDLDDDNDGLTDIDETTIYGTDPLRVDTDNDGASDGDEVNAGTNPLVNPAIVLPVIIQLLDDN